MDNIVKETLNFPFDISNYVKFNLQIFDKLNLNQDKDLTNFPSSFKNKIVLYKIIGTQEKNDEKILILSVKLSKYNSVEKSRSMQRSFAKWILETNDCDACLIAFHDDESEDWRFSLVTINYERKIDGDKIKVSKVLSSVKRYSYLVGRNEPNHTAQQQIVPLTKNKNETNINKLVEAFSVEKVNQDFFISYKKICDDVAKELDALKKKDYKLKEDFKKNKIISIEFAKKLVGQVVFIYFLQKKRWVGNKFKNNKFEKNAPRNFLKNLFDFYKDKKINFFNDILEPLFYEGFGTKRKNNFYKKLNCFIPFLSSELFEPINNYDWEKTNVTLSNNTFEVIFSVFDRYNFTVREEEPLEKDVAIDPEMLGKVLENLLPDKKKKQSGTFYTPRPVVNYMCESSISKYLFNLNSKFTPDFIENLFKVSENDEFTQQNFNKYKNSAPELDLLLKNITICDPAIGSAAFPVAMMNKIVKCRIFLNLINKKKVRISEIKKNFIEKSMFGVDIEPSAIETAKLRLWLSLIVDEESVENFTQLPNLDFKIMQGNSLIDEINKIKLDEKFTTNTLESEEFKNDIDKLLSKVKILKNSVLYLDDYKKKLELRKKINELLYKILKLKNKQSKQFGIKQEENLNIFLNDKEKKNFFAWKLYFSEIFAKGGFDIVIANPPYVSYGLRDTEKLSKDDKDILKKLYPNSAEYKISYYALFMELSLRITKQNGVNILIVPDSFLLGRYFSKIRKHILNNSDIDFISLFNYKIFEADVGYSVIYQLTKNLKPNLKEFDSNLFQSEIELVKKNQSKFRINSKYYLNVGYNKFRLFFDINTKNIIEKIEKNSLPLIKFIQGNTGIRSKIGKENIISKTKKNQYYKKGLISSSQIDHFTINYKDDWISTDPKILHGGGFDPNKIEKDKILMCQTGDHVKCAFDDNKFYHLNNIHSFCLLNNKINIKAIVSYLNSSLFKFYYQNVTLEKKRAMAQIDIETIESLKIFLFPEYTQQKLIQIEDKLRNNTDKSSNKFQKDLNEIDNIIFESFNLNEEEIIFIKEYNLE